MLQLFVTGVLSGETYDEDIGDWKKLKVYLQAVACVAQRQLVSFL